MSESASTSLPQWRDPLEEFAGEIERAQTLGRAIYECDMVAIWATDALMARRIIPEDGRLRGYFVTFDGESREAHFIGQVGEDYCELYTVGFGELSQTAAIVLEHPSPAPLAGDRKAMFLAQQTAASHPVKRFTETYNTVVLPGHLVREAGWLVYLLASTTEPDTALLGGHYRLRISADGSTVESATALSGSLLRFSPCPDTGESMFVTYGLSQMPIETHVSFQLLYRVRLEVGIAQTMAPYTRYVEWCVDDGMIGINRIGQPSVEGCDEDDGIGGNEVGQPSGEGCAEEGKSCGNTVGQPSVERGASIFGLLVKSVVAVFALYWLLRLILPSLIPALDVVWVLTGSLAFGYAVVGIVTFSRKACHWRSRDSEAADIGKQETTTAKNGKPQRPATVQIKSGVFCDAFPMDAPQLALRILDRWVVSELPPEIGQAKKASYALGYIYNDHSAGLSMDVHAFLILENDGSFKQLPSDQRMLIWRYPVFLMGGKLNVLAEDDLARFSLTREHRKSDGVE